MPTPLTHGSIDELVKRIAGICALLRDEVTERLTREESGEADAAFSILAGNWKDLLFPDARPEEFADHYSQTLTFAILLARLDRIDLGKLSLPDVAIRLGKRHSLMGKALAVLTDHPPCPGLRNKGTEVTPEIPTHPWARSGGPRLPGLTGARPECLMLVPSTQSRSVDSQSTVLWPKTAILARSYEVNLWGLLRDFDSLSGNNPTTLANAAWLIQVAAMSSIDYGLTHELTAWLDAPPLTVPSPMPHDAADVDTLVPGHSEKLDEATPAEDREVPQAAGFVLGSAPCRLGVTAQRGKFGGDTLHLCDNADGKPGGQVLLARVVVPLPVGHSPASASASAWIFLISAMAPAGSSTPPLTTSSRCRRRAAREG
ncbi:hypothetical protein SLINC_2624 [Streptomyces lincolnensis]|uniref:Uncharacterized protein n=1 Tax=Streptomyces lincolnensis TaxID=1915 RepID=A0A1B1M882_STRLN|nr:hypothetical protein SLINC_2624 [Streptomyces lincolnensis]AXG56944.1 hypothetical protein SLCG_5789 [Streptomyces lincolnensis]